MHPVALLLADGRWPGGGYAHSGGLEPAVAEGAVHDAASLASFAAGRLTTIGVVEAWLTGAAWAAASIGDHHALSALQDECEARTPSPCLRAAGRGLGRGLRRVAQRVWPSVVFDTSIEQYPVVLGAVAAAGGLSQDESVQLCVHHALFGPLNAAPKLMPIDMADVCAIAVQLAPVASAAVAEAMWALDTDDQPCWSAPLIELRAERHADWEVRLFAS